MKEFSAVILYQHPVNAYYKSEYTGGSYPPDCSSFDGINGIGDPGGHCLACPHNRFGLGENGSKAFKNRRRIYVLREGELFPMILSLPTGSLKGFSRFIKRLLNKGRIPKAVVTRFSLKKATSSGGIAYTQAQFAVDREFTEDEVDLLSTLSDQVRAYSERISHDMKARAIGPVVDTETGEIIKPT